MENNYRRVLVLGGGIAGVQASLDLAEMGTEVYLVERGPSIGGRMAQLDKTFPTNDCSMCILSPKLVEAGTHPYINIITNGEVQSVTGEAPDFEATVLKKPRYVDEEKCTGCGICVEKCPVKIPDEFNKGLSKTKCIRIPFPQAVPAVAIIDKAYCIYHQREKCRICEKFCDAEAIDFEQKEEILHLRVGSIILASGLSEFNPTFKDEYGYRTFPNVLTSIELERILGASGPTQGRVLRPSDGEEPERIAFIQCVGSRDMQAGREYCSAFCCMQAAKDSIILTEHLPDVESTVFCMDIRAYGKDFDKFVEKAQNEHGVRFMRARISSVEIEPENENLIIQYSTDGHRVERESFELLILSVGLESSPEAKEFVESLGIELNPSGFVNTNSFTPVSTSRSGIFVCGTLSGPKDIPESVMQASASASAASCMLSRLPVKEIAVDYPPEKDIRGDPPRIGVFVCHCGINIAGTVDVPQVVEYVSKLPQVIHCEEMLFACSQDAQKLISEAIEEKRLNRVIVAACTPRTHEPLFQKTLRGSGLNPYLFEFANIREQCSWVHQKEPQRATEKAKDIVRMAVSKARLLEPLAKMRLGVRKGALVIGGGLAGMVAAKDLAEQGYEVHLVEREGELGGNLKHIGYTLQAEPTDQFLQTLIESVSSNEKITLHTDTKIEEIRGYVGNFETTLKQVKSKKLKVKSAPPKTQDAGHRTQDPVEIEHGVVIVATGAKEYEPKEYLYGEDDRVVTQRELERLLWQDRSQKQEARGKKSLSLASPRPEASGLKAGISHLASVVMIQCVGSRDDEHPYCSRVCCSTAVKNALKLKELNPKVRVYVLYRDVRTYGLKELYYKLARERGVVFVRYDDEKPKVSKEGDNLTVEATDDILARRLRFQPDLLVLSTGVVANEDNKLLSQLLKVPLGGDGFFLEAHVKLRPVDFATDGVFVCGLAHYPKDIPETVAQARAAAARAATVLSKTEIEAEGKVSQVKVGRCSGCGICVEVCAYKAIELDPEEGIAVVNEALCKGCGACAASCRAAAIDLKGFRDEEILAALAAI